MTLVPLIRCTMDPPCGHCWYCEQWGELEAELTEARTASFEDWQRAGYAAGWRKWRGL